MYRVSLFALTSAGSGDDQQKLVKMALVHDIAEAIVGDIAPSDNVSKEDKHARESAAVTSIVNMLGANTLAAQEISALWCRAHLASLVPPPTPPVLCCPAAMRNTP